MSVETQIKVGRITWLFVTSEAWLAEVDFLAVDVVTNEIGVNGRFNRARGVALVGSSGVSLLGHSYNSHAPAVMLDGRLRNELSLAVSRKVQDMLLPDTLGHSIARLNVQAHSSIVDSDIWASGLGDPDVCETCPRMVAWLRVQGYDPAVVSERIIGSIVANPRVIAALADLVGRPVRVVLHEMTNTPEPEGPA